MDIDFQYLAGQSSVTAFPVTFREHTQERTLSPRRLPDWREQKPSRDPISNHRQIPTDQLTSALRRSTSNDLHRLGLANEAQTENFNPRHTGRNTTDARHAEPPIGRHPENQASNNADQPTTPHSTHGRSGNRMSRILHLPMAILRNSNSQRPPTATGAATHTQNSSSSAVPRSTRAAAPPTAHATTTQHATRPSGSSTRHGRSNSSTSPPPYTPTAVQPPPVSTATETRHVNRSTSRQGTGTPAVPVSHPQTPTSTRTHQRVETPGSGNRGHAATHSTHLPHDRSHREPISTPAHGNPRQVPIAPRAHTNYPMQGPSQAAQVPFDAEPAQRQATANFGAHLTGATGTRAVPREGTATPRLAERQRSTRSLRRSQSRSQSNLRRSSSRRDIPIFVGGVTERDSTTGLRAVELPDDPNERFASNYPAYIVSDPTTTAFLVRKAYDPDAVPFVFNGACYQFSPDTFLACAACPARRTKGPYPMQRCHKCSCFGLTISRWIKDEEPVTDPSSFHTAPFECEECATPRQYLGGLENRYMRGLCFKCRKDTNIIPRPLPGLHGSAFLCCERCRIQRAFPLPSLCGRPCSLGITRTMMVLPRPPYIHPEVQQQQALRHQNRLAAMFAYRRRG